ncbi:MAG: TlpA disulfide reductase family protein [Myxococcota bacterium]|nr:TlpA disulfide reductase family protein [Myxococcota bacterium]
MFFLRAAPCVIFIAYLLTACGGSAVGSHSTTGSEPTSPAQDSQESSDGGEIADFVLKDVDGKDVALSDYLGKKVIVISYWATWCEPCKREMIQLHELFLQYKDKGLMVLSISMDEPETQGEVRPYIKQRGYTFPVLLDTESVVTNQFNPRRAAPFTLIISMDQKIVWTHDSYVPGDEKLVEAEILKALGEPTG